MIAAAVSASLKEFQAQFGQRLRVLSRSLDLLVEEEGRGAWVADLVRSQLEPFGAIDGMRILAEGPAVYLRPDAAQNIGLALYELATNASKHKALSVPEGAVHIFWRLAHGQFRLIWEERNGPKVVTPTCRGFGAVVLQRMAGQAAHGQVKHEFKPGGVSWTLEIPADATIIGRTTFAGPEFEA